MPKPIKSPTRLYDNIESELLREQLLATSAESPAEAFVKRLLNPSPASRSKFEELLRAATAEASLAATATQAKESALENEDLREQLAASEAAVAALHASSSFEVPTTKGAVQHLRLEGEIDAASKVDAKGVAHRRRLASVEIFGESYAPETTTYLRVPPASPTPGAPRDRPSASQVPREQQDHRHVPERPL